MLGGDPGEEAGQLLSVDQYSGSSMGNLPIGQGESVTPMQMAAAYTAIANGGVLRAPRIVKQVDDQSRPLTRGRRIISRETARSLRDMLKGVLAPGGTAAEATVPGYELAGKTGTATTGDDTPPNAWFTAFAPAGTSQPPSIAVSVIVLEGGGLGDAATGGQIAAPIAREVIGAYLG